MLSREYIILATQLSFFLNITSFGSMEKYLALKFLAIWFYINQAKHKFDHFWINILEFSLIIWVNLFQGQICHSYINLYI